MYQVTRWSIADALAIAEGQLTINELREMAPAAEISEIVEGIKVYLEEKECV